MKNPEKPLPSDCCGQGCTPCVFEQYANQRAIYEDWLKNQKNKGNQAKGQIVTRDESAVNENES